MRRQKSLLIVGLILSALTGCNQSYSQVQQPSPTPKLKVVTTFLPMYWFTKAVVGEEQPVELLIPPGTEVHDYQATPANVSAIATANILVKNGIDFEEFLEGTVKSAQNSQLKEINASANIKSLAGNPHVWLDPVLAKQQVINIRDGLVAANPEKKATYQANATTYIQKLEKLDAEYKQRLQKYPNCTFISFHDAYPYLANRYQIKQIAVVEIPEDQLSPTDIQKTINAVKQYKAKAIFGEPGVDNKLLKALSQDLNLTLQPLDSLESGTLDPQHYFTAMQGNLKTLESACK
ncbi:metal ABC transporter solute-binding protein, Zn/Mn family [Synechocystis sp. PCC 7509]|uniref:metal ABC transporter solute-binding protein, Zn/Mn family n=1 Tax=Synechocystis sp. PCC 7509 TaxID=927677 RepID=UPI0002ABD7EF|nr:zinc ABC transporter substrate-binding protein [Synechocystis sp. PCC 7509]